MKRQGVDCRNYVLKEQWRKQNGMRSEKEGELQGMDIGSSRESKEWKVRHWFMEEMLC